MKNTTGEPEPKAATVTRKIKVTVSPGDKWAIVYDWHETADRIREHARGVGAFRDTEFGTVWLVEWDQLGVPPGISGIGNVCMLTDADLDTMVGYIHDSLRSHAH